MLRLLLAVGAQATELAEALIADLSGGVVFAPVAVHLACITSVQALDADLARALAPRIELQQFSVGEVRFQVPDLLGLAP